MTGMWVGIDVSKAFLDVHLAGAQGGLRVRNDAAGHGELLARLGGAPVAGVVLEASGGYERPVQAALSAAGLAVALANPGARLREGHREARQACPRAGEAGPVGPIVSTRRCSPTTGPF